MIRPPPRFTLDRSSAASDVYKRQVFQPLLRPAFDLVAVAQPFEVAIEQSVQPPVGGLLAHKPLHFPGKTPAFSSTAMISSAGLRASAARAQSISSAPREVQPLVTKAETSRPQTEATIERWGMIGRLLGENVRTMARMLDDIPGRSVGARSKLAGIAPRTFPNAWTLRVTHPAGGPRAHAARASTTPGGAGKCSLPRGPRWFSGGLGRPCASCWRGATRPCTCRC